MAVRAVQRAIDPLTVRFEGDHVTREPFDHLRAEGFEIETIERLKVGDRRARRRRKGWTGPLAPGAPAA